MKLLHFSDVHAGDRPRASGYVDKRLIGSLNYLVRRRKDIKWERFHRSIEIIHSIRPDAVIITGDFTTTGSPEEFRKAAMLMEPLVKDKSIELICIPGNHDYYVKSRKCRNAADLFFKHINRGRFDVPTMPCRHDVGPVSFFMLNTARPNPLHLSSGFISDETVAKVGRWAEDATDRFRILLTHYPLLNKDGNPLQDRRRLINGEKLLPLLRSGDIDASFCGHIHAPFSRQEDGGGMEVCAGSLTISGKLNLFEVDAHSRQINQEWLNAGHVLKG